MKKYSRTRSDNWQAEVSGEVETETKNPELLDVDEKAEYPYSTSIYSHHQYYEMLKKRTIVFNDSMDDFTVEYGIVPLLEMAKTKGPIHILLQTPGGPLFSGGMVMCDILDNIEVPVTITVLGQAFSMGMYLLMAGYNNPNVTKRAYKHSVGLLHGGDVNICGTASQTKDFMEFNDHYEEKLKQYVLSHSRITEEEYDKKWHKELFLTADQMLELGIIDEIIGG